MDELPGEMVVAVLGWVEAPDLLASRLVCRRWRHLLATPTTSGGGEVWRRSYLRTWPPPLLCSAAQHAAVIAAAAAAARPIDWHALCLQRLGLQRHSDQEARMAEVAALLRSAATLAVPAPLGADEIINSSTGAPDEKVKDSESDDDDESAPAALQAAAHQRHIADVQGPVEKAQQVLAYLNRVAGLRQRAHQLIHSFGPQGKANATGEKASKEHLLTMLFHGNLLYETIHHKATALGDIMHSMKYEASVVVYSLVTGLPLRMTYAFFYNQVESIDTLSWKSLAGDLLEGKVGDKHSRATAKERADRAAALQVFLFGRENADTVDPPTLEKFIEGVFVPADNFYIQRELQWPRA